MVRGLEKFKEYFKDYIDYYIVIEGTACEEHFEAAGAKFRLTKDIDVVLVVEAIDAKFVSKFWDFILEGNYEKKETSKTVRKYYRFNNPENIEFPVTIELFSRKPNIIEPKDGMTLTPIPMDEDVSSLSAILLDKNYYDLVVNSSKEEGNFHFASIGALICLKARAYLDMKKRKENGEKVDSDDIKKHRNDVFRLATLLTDEAKFALSNGIKQDLNEFMNKMISEPPDFSALSKSMGQKLDGIILTNLICKVFLSS